MQAIAISVATLFTGFNLQSEAITINDVLELIEARREVVSNIEWDFSETQYIVPSLLDGSKSIEEIRAAGQKRAKGDLSPFTQRKTVSCSGQVRYDGNGGRFLVRFADVFLADKNRTFSCRQTISFDGKTYWNEKWWVHGAELPPERYSSDMDPLTQGRPDGVIGGPPEQDRLDIATGASGLSFRPGFIAFPNDSNRGNAVPLAAFLRSLAENDALRLEMPEEGVAVLAFDLKEEGVAWIEIQLRLDQMAAIEEVRYMQAASTARRTTGTVESYRIRNSEIAPGIWFPSEIIWGRWMTGPFAVLVEISNARIVEEFDDQDFQIEFQDGVHAVDHDSKLSFFVGLNPVNEDQAIRDYARSYLGDFEAGGHGEYEFPWIWVISGFVLTGGLGYIIISRRSVKIGILLWFAVAGNTCCAGSLAWSDTQGWGLQFGKNGEFIRVSQCGHRVTSLALHAFRRNFDTLALAKHLRPTTAGISAFQIKEVLESFGLNVSARKRVSWNDLYNDLDAGVFGVVLYPQTNSSPGHFVCAFKRKQLVILDPPYARRSFTASDVASFPKSQLLALLISDHTHKIRKRYQSQLKAKRATQLLLQNSLSYRTAM